MSSHRVVFTFDQPSYEVLNALTDEARFASKAQTVRESLRVARALLSQAKQGYTEVIVRNPENQRERMIVIPFLQEARAPV